MTGGEIRSTVVVTANYNREIRRFPMGSHRTTTVRLDDGFGPLRPDEEALLDQMTASFGECVECGCDGLYVTIWTPARTVRRIMCAVCLAPFWTAPGAVR